MVFSQETASGGKYTFELYANAFAILYGGVRMFAVFRFAHHSIRMKMHGEGKFFDCSDIKASVLIHLCMSSCLSSG